MSSPAGAPEGRSTVSTIIVMACTAGSRLLGYVKMALIAAVFGAGGPADVINIVFNIPNSLRKLFAEGAFSAAFIPVLSSTLAEEASGEGARRLVRSLAAFLLVVLVPLVALSLALPKPFVRLLLDFHDPAQFPQAEELLRWMFNYILLVSLAALAQAVLNSHGRFTVPALSPLVFSAAIILAVAVLGRRLGPRAMGLGVLVGGVLQLVVLLPPLRRLGYGLAPRPRFADPAFRQTIRLWAPFVASASIFALNQFVAQYFASGLEQGSVSAVANAVTVMNLPIGIFTASVMTVLFPRMSAEASRGDRQGLRATVVYGFEFLLALLVPSSAALLIIGREIVAVAFQRGRFTDANTLMAARVLSGYAVGLALLSLYQFLQRLFYSAKDFRTPLASALVVSAVDIGLSLWLKETRLRVAGLAVANSAAFLAGFLFLAAAAWRRLEGFDVRRCLVGFAKACLAAVPPAALLIAYRQLAPERWRQGGTVGLFAVVAGLIGAAGLATLGMFALLRMPFAMQLVRRRRNG